MTTSPTSWLQRAASVACVLTLAGLVTHNVALALKNQDELRPELVPRIKPRDIQQMAAEDHKPLIYGRLAHFYYLEQRVPGATIRLGPFWRSWKWEFENVARMKVKHSETPFIMHPRSHRWLKKKIKKHYMWDAGLLRPGKHKWERLWILIDNREKDYVVADSVRDGARGRDIFIVPYAVWRSHGLPNHKIPPELWIEQPPSELDP